MQSDHADLAIGSGTRLRAATPIACASGSGMDPGLLVGRSVYNERHRRIGIIDSVAATRDNRLMCMVTGVEGWLGIGRIPLDALTPVGDRLYRSSLARRLRALP